MRPAVFSPLLPALLLPGTARCESWDTRLDALALRATGYRMTFTTETRAFGHAFTVPSGKTVQPDGTVTAATIRSAAFARDYLVTATGGGTELRAGFVRDRFVAVSRDAAGCSAVRTRIPDLASPLSDRDAWPQEIPSPVRLPGELVGLPPGTRHHFRLAPPPTRDVGETEVLDRFGGGTPGFVAFERGGAGRLLRWRIDFQPNTRQEGRSTYGDGPFPSSVVIDHSIRRPSSGWTVVGRTTITVRDVERISALPPAFPEGCVVREVDDARRIPSVDPIMASDLHPRRRSDPTAIGVGIFLALAAAEAVRRRRQSMRKTG